MENVKRVPVVLQMEAVECGAASLAMILAYYKRFIPLEKMRIDCNVTRDGSLAKYIVKAAAKHELETKAYKMDPEQIRQRQDFPMIIAPINRVAGRDVRALPYMHWWTFIGYYMEIGDCTFSTILDIRRKLRKHKKLEKWEREYYDENRELIEFKSAHLTDDEDEFIRQLMTGGVRDG